MAAGRSCADDAEENLPTLVLPFLFLPHPHKHKHTLIQAVVTKGLRADDWVQAVIAVIGGKGGGTATNAQASGPNMEKLTEARAAATQYATDKLQ